MQKKYLIKSINFGKQNNPARAMVEDFNKQFGKKEFSKFVRRAVIIMLSSETQSDWNRMKAEYLEKEYNDKLISSTKEANFAKIQRDEVRLRLWDEYKIEFPNTIDLLKERNNSQDGKLLEEADKALKDIGINKDRVINDG